MCSPSQVDGGLRLRALDRGRARARGRSRTSCSARRSRSPGACRADARARRAAPRGCGARRAARARAPRAGRGRAGCRRRPRRRRPRARQRSSARGLRVAVQVDALRGRSRPPARARSSPPEATSQPIPSSAEQPVDGGAGERLGGEDDLEVVGAGRERLHEGPRSRAHVVLGDDVSRRAELARELDRVAAADLQPPGLAHAAAHRVDVRELLRCGHRRRIMPRRAHRQR